VYKEALLSLVVQQSLAIQFNISGDTMTSAVFFLLFSFCNGPQTLKVGSFNCEFMNREKVHIKYGYHFNLEGEDLELWEQKGLREKKFKQALGPVAKVIVKMGVDVLVLVEVGDQHDVNDLRKTIKSKGIEYPFFFVSKSLSATFQHVAVLSKYPLDLVADKIPGGSFYDTELDDPEEERETDVQKAIHVQFKFHGQKINLIGVHLPSERNGHEQDAMRIAVASLIRRYSIPILERGEHLIIAGDLNDGPGEPAIRMLRGREDIFEDLIQTGHTDYFKPREYKDRWTYMYKGQRNLLDQMLVSRSLRNRCVEEQGILAHVQKVDIFFRPSLKQPRTSDHRALVETFTFK